MTGRFGATDSFGMVSQLSTALRDRTYNLLSHQGVDLPDILLVVQWRMTCTMTALWQRLGRAVRDRRLEGIGVLFAEAKYFDDEREAKKSRKSRKRKPVSAQPTTPRKRQCQTLPDLEPLSPSKLVNRTTLLTGTGPAEDEGAAIVDDFEAEEVPDSEPEQDDAVEEETLDDTVAGTVAGVGEAVRDDGSEAQAFIEIRRQLYDEHAKGKASTAIVKSKEKELDLELQDFINADTRKLGCRRIPIKAFFSADSGEAGE